MLKSRDLVETGKTGTIARERGLNTMLSFKSINSTISFGLLIISLQLTWISTISANEPITVSSGKYQTAVFELYTSEGCSSCPPADRWFNELVKIPENELDVLALAFHVDYWDYIGWKDKYANPAYTNRQRHLARMNQQSSIYTPEFFVNGTEARGTRSVVQKILSSNRVLSNVDLELTLQQQNNNILINLSSQFDPERTQLVRFVVFENHLSSDVKRGENAGRQLHHQQVVRYLSPKKELQTEISHSIMLKPEWKQANLGIGALVSAKNGDYLQAVFTHLDKNI